MLRETIEVLQGTLTLFLEDYPPEKILAYVVFAYCFERISFPFIMSGAKLVFYANCYLHDRRMANQASTFIGHRRMPGEAINGDNCSICHDQLKEVVFTTCRHEFCQGCIVPWFIRHNSCPICRQGPIAWRDTPPFLAAVLWSYVYRHLMEKQTTAAISIAVLVLAYLSPDPDMFFVLKIGIPSVMLAVTMMHFGCYIALETDILDDQSPSHDYEDFRWRHFFKVYLGVYWVYRVYRWAMDVKGVPPRI